ncbi:type II secretion system protein GspH [Salinivibrio sp. IB868]|uniref:type II secretion system minor pseudopilin GspH n=1 Tax=unclassified Salinivibrio TaxID=2636825 RepID=UPI0009CACEC5|nr:MULTISPECIES: type II secretion system minor pseudopilin GspH [unclassified Salinivibrio]OOE64377.1 type II secretion system protein GspH [Salinivibrio sp. IB868]OOE72047.1 type II secretion system protein GspH [Salinivibrio sp. IB870]
MRQAAGFTLLEILLVVVIVAVSTSGVIMVMPESADTRTQEAGQALYQRMKLWAEQSWLEGRTYGVRIEQQRYQLLVLGQEQWQPVSSDRWATQGRLPEQSRFVLTMDGFGWQQQDRLFEDKPLFEDLFDEDDEQAVAPPQIWLLPNGELTPFTLMVETDGRAAWQLKANELAQFTWQRAGEGDDVSTR